jgi:hypothetical protein
VKRDGRASEGVKIFRQVGYDGRGKTTEDGVFGYAFRRGRAI